MLLYVVIIDSMKDTKLKKSGLGGAPCILCKTTVPDWSDPSKLKTVSTSIEMQKTPRSSFRSWWMTMLRFTPNQKTLKA